MKNGEEVSGSACRTAHDGDRDRLSESRHVWRIAWVSVGLFAFSLAFCSRSGLRWESRGQYDTEIGYIGVGLPHWLFLSSLETNGLSTPPASAPDWLEYQRRYPPGLHIRIMPLLLSLFSIAGFATLFYGIALLSGRYSSVDRGHRLILAYMVAVIPALVVGMVSITAPAWVRSTLGLGITMVGTATGAAIARSYRHGALMGFLVVAAIWWSTTVIDFWYGGGHIEHEFPDENDMSMFIVSAPVTVFIALIAVLVCRYAVRRSRSGAEKEQSKLNGGHAEA